MSHITKTYLWHHEQINQHTQSIHFYERNIGKVFFIYKLYLMLFYFLKKTWLHFLIVHCQTFVIWIKNLATQMSNQIVV